VLARHNYLEIIMPQLPASDCDPITYATRRPVPIVYVQGSHYQMGQQVGEDRREVIHHTLATYRGLFQSEADRLHIYSWDEAILHARKYLPFAEESVPQYVEELRGVADGAGLDFNDLLVLNCMEALTEDALHRGCTSLAAAPEMTADGSLLVGHNEDWLPEDFESVYLIHAQPDDEPAFLAITYGGLLPNIGFNQHGIAQCCDSVYPNDARVGVPRIFVSRAVLAAMTPAGAIQAALNRRRAAGYNHLIAHVSGEIYNVEVSAREFELIYAMDGLLAHTNHYLSRPMRAIERDSDELIPSRVRYNRVMRLLHSQQGQISRASIQSLLSDHVNFPESICNHVSIDDYPLDRQQTIAALVMDLTNLTMDVAWGTPCCSEFYTYRLETPETVNAERIAANG
jgi:isopenicillin-N N-acyltransferase-like protein